MATVSDDSNSTWLDKQVDIKITYEVKFIVINGFTVKH